VARLKGAFAAYDEPQLGATPTVVPFQYNPDRVTRVLRHELPAGGGGGPLAAAGPPREEYALTLELDASDGLDAGQPLSAAVGVAPRLAALEQLMQPVPDSGGSALAGRPRPVARLPLVLLTWVPAPTVPVRLTSLSIAETAFNALLAPVQASVEVSLLVLRAGDLPPDAVLGRAAAAAAATSRRSAAGRAAAVAAEQVPRGGV
jgi:hypothetical protein